MAQKMRTIIIGDIHGCCRTLEALLRQAEYDSGQDRIIFVGDYIDRGPRIKETLDFLIRLKEEAGERAVFLMGNHERMLLDVAHDEFEGSRFFEHTERRARFKRNRLTCFYDSCRMWLRNGGTETEKQIFDALSRPVYDGLLKWLDENLVYDYRDPEGRFSVTHAGAEYGVDLDSNETKVWNREFGIYGGALVICGHTPVEAPSLSGKFIWQAYDYGKMYDLPARGVLNIDTGCVYGSRFVLTGMVIEDDRFHLISEHNRE